MLYTKVGTKAAVKPETSYGLIHHFLKLIKLTLKNRSSDYWINIFQSLKFQRYTPISTNVLYLQHKHSKSVSIWE